ncbi:unnamed protein product [Ixodes persulcatus]
MQGETGALPFQCEPDPTVPAHFPRVGILKNCPVGRCRAAIAGARLLLLRRGRLDCGFTSWSFIAAPCLQGQHGQRIVDVRGHSRGALAVSALGAGPALGRPPGSGAESAARLGTAGPPADVAAHLGNCSRSRPRRQKCGALRCPGGDCAQTAAARARSERPGVGGHDEDRHQGHPRSRLEVGRPGRSRPRRGQGDRGTWRGRLDPGPVGQWVHELLPHGQGGEVRPQDGAAAP